MPPEPTTTDPSPAPPRGTAVEVLRWIAVLPLAGFIAFAGATAVAGVAYVLVGIRRAGDPPLSEPVDLLLQVVTHFPQAALFVLAAGAIAPRRSFATAVVLALIWIALSLRTHILTQPHWGSTHVLHFACESAGALLGAAVVYFVGRWAKAAS